MEARDFLDEVKVKQKFLNLHKHVEKRHKNWYYSIYSDILTEIPDKGGICNGNFNSKRTTGASQS